MHFDAVGHDFSSQGHGLPDIRIFSRYRLNRLQITRGEKGDGVNAGLAHTNKLVIDF